jgi:hypothetical protein
MYVLAGILAYLVLGIILTRYAAASTMRMKFRDAALGAFFMPVLTACLLLFIFLEKAWKRILIALHFDPPEEMRAGPKESAERESD